jgi:phosphoglycolate phosphatase-like HAD superfamily hydrolase
MDSVALRAVFLDVDGVLLDSLSQHLAICRDKAREYGLVDLVIPDVEGFRRIVREGTSVSPMLNFFLALGFPPDMARRGVADYEREFMQRYRPLPFRGVDAMLAELRAAGLLLGLVTANTAGNVEPALGTAMRHFDPRCLFYVDRFPEARSKAWCLAEGARVLQLPPRQCVYVGDQPADLAGARAAGFQFLGVSYGWGLAAGDPTVRVVATVPAIAQVLAPAAQAVG